MGSSTASTTLLGEITATRDGQRSGAVDVAWDGVRASIYFVFGQPSHATFAAGDRSLDGGAALDRLIAEIPDDADVSGWRRVMIPEDTLRCTVDELLARCSARLEGGGAETGRGADPTVDNRLVVPFGVDDFPLLPLGTSLWSDAAANVVHLDMLAPKLPDSLIMLTGTGRRAAAVVAHGTIVDAVWVDGSTGLVGEEAAQALMNTGDGTVSGYGLDDERLLAAIPLLWRSPRLITGLQAAWLDVDRMVAAIREDGHSCALLVDGDVTGAALFYEGELVATYTEHRRRPSTTPAALRTLLRTPGAQVTVIREGENRPLERRLGEEAFHLFMDHEAIATGFAPGVVDDSQDAAENQPSSDAATEAAPPTLDAVVAASPDAEDSGPEVADAVDGAGPGADHADGNGVHFGSPAEPLSHLPPDVFSLPELIGAPPPPPLSLAAPGLDDVDADAGLVPDGEPVESPVDSAPPNAAVELADDDSVAAPAQPGPLTWDEDVAPSASASNGHLPAASSDFVPTRLEFDVDALRRELTEIATVWLGADDIGLVSELIEHARPGVDEFVATIAAIGALQVPGHETAVVRAMAREMHFRAAEVLCGV